MGIVTFYRTQGCRTHCTLLGCTSLNDPSKSVVAGEDGDRKAAPPFVLEGIAE